MSDYRAKIDEALREGHSVKSIVDHLNSLDMRVGEARNAGHSDKDILEYLRQNPASPADSWRVAPGVQATREENALAIKQDELADDPLNKDLKKDIAFSERRLSNQRKLAADEAPRASQSDVRASEPFEEPTTLAKRQEKRAALEKQRDDLVKRWRRETGGVLKPGETVEQAVTAMFPEYETLYAEIERTGVGSTGRTVGSAVGGVIGAIGGGVAGSMGSPLGTALGGIAGSAVGTGVGSILGSKYDLYAAGRHAVSVSPEEASQFVQDNAIDDIVWDGVGNAVLFGGGKAIKLAVNPAERAALKKVVFEAVAKKRAAPTIAARDATTETFMDPHTLTTPAQSAEDVLVAQARAEAVPELIQKSGGALPTKGQISGKPGWGESIQRAAGSRAYESAEEALQRGAKEMQHDFLEPAEQMSRPGMGAAVADAADATVKAVKDKTGRVFERARGEGVAVDMEPTLAVLKKYVDEYARAGSSMAKGEIEKLRETLQLLENQRVAGHGGGVYLSAGDAQGFISARKQAARELIDGNTPTTYFQKALDEVSEAADKAFLDSIGKSKVNPDLKKELLQARAEYRSMNETMFSDDLRRALRKKPEDVGEFFYTKGTVTELKNLDKALDLAIKEGAMTDAEAIALREGMTRDFIGRIAADPSKWTEKLRTDKRIRDTLNALSSRPGMADFAKGMRKVEEAAKIAERRNADLALGGTVANAPGRAIVGITFGFLSLFTGGAILAGAGVARVLATAATRGDKGIVRSVQVLMQAYKAGDKAMSSPVVRTALEDVIKYASDNGIDLVVQPQPTQEQ